MTSEFYPQSIRISTELYERMVGAGIFAPDERIELIEGQMLDTAAPFSPKHAAALARLTKLFVLSLGDSALVSPGGPVNLGSFSQPQPDLLVLKWRSDSYSANTPQADDIQLLVEVSDHTLEFDQSVKLDLYARHQVREYWVVDLRGKRVVVYRDPGPQGFRCAQEFYSVDSLTPQEFPSVQVRMSQILGPPHI